MKSKINIPKAFFSFLIASFFIWLLINLSKDYVTTISYEVTYQKLPQNKVFQEEPLKKVDLQVRASGFKLLSSNFYKKDLIFYLDKIKYNSENKYYILPKHQDLIIQKQLYKGLQLEKILKDSIFLNLGSLLSKKVSILPNVKLNYEHGYDLTSPIEVMPDSVLISGPKLQIDKIDNLKTALLELDDLSENKEAIVKIKIPKDLNKVKISEKEVALKILIDKFTEGEFLVPFEIENLPYGTKINTFPKQVKVVFKVGLNNFNNITASSFKIVCDYRVSKENNLPYLIPRVDVKPNMISSVRLFPKKVEFLIQE